MKRVYFIAASLLVCCTQQSRTATLEPETVPFAAPEVRLCEALDRIKPGDHVSITVTGIYAVGYEHQIFYDPVEPTCSTNVQPSTWMEFASDVKLSAEASGWLNKSGRVYLTILGDLYGPRAVGPDDLSLPVNIAFANRAGGRRYGHLNGFRTKLVVHKVIEARQVPDAMPSTELWHRAAALSAAPIVSRADTPSYPGLALNARITGTVVVNVTVSKGEITSTTVESGDRVLAAGAIQNIKSWHFEEGTSQTFTATFIYEVERRDAGANPNPKIEMQLPSLVRVTAASRDW